MWNDNVISFLLSALCRGEEARPSVGFLQKVKKASTSALSPSEGANPPLQRALSFPLYHSTNFTTPLKESKLWTVSNKSLSLLDYGSI